MAIENLQNVFGVYHFLMFLKMFLAIDSHPKKKPSKFLPSFLASSPVSFLLLLRRIVFSFLCVVAIWSPPPLVRSEAQHSSGFCIVVYCCTIFWSGE
jgi:hypothetical protein